MENIKYVMGFDGGTGGVRVGIYTLDGNEVAYHHTQYETKHQKVNWAEQNPNEWWEKFGEASKLVIQESNINPNDIVSLSYDVTSCSVVLSEFDGTPVRDSLIWMDVRAGKEAQEITQTKHDVLRFNGYGNVSAEWMPSKALWLKRNERDNYDKADVVCEYADWITFKMTGKWIGNINNAATRWYYDSTIGGFPKDFYAEIGLEDVLSKFPKITSKLGDNIGHLTQDAAEHLGLTTNTIVGQGGIDAFIGMLGLGVTEPGKISLITGSSHLITGLVEENNYKYSKSGMFGPFPDNLIPGLGMIEGGQTSSGSIISWFKNEIATELKDKDNAYDILNEEAAKIKPGSDGILVLDWWQGNRTPYTNPNINGMIYGLQLSHTRGHIFRAIMEGIAYGTENVFESFRNSGYKVDEIYIGGGTTNSDLFMQIHADVSNVKIHVPKNPQSMTLGSAMLAAVAVGWYENIQDAADNMVHYEKVIEPNIENHKLYKKYFEQYQSSYPVLKDWMKDFNKIKVGRNES